MPRRLNYTGRKKINRTDAMIRLHQNGHGLAFDADVRLADYKLETITPPPRVYVEAYRGASTLWKRFDFGRVGAIQPPDDRSLAEFGVPEGILFRIKVSAEGEALGKLLAEADRIRPRLPGEEEGRPDPLIRHQPSDEIGDELWRLDFTDDLPLMLINDRVPGGFHQFLSDPRNQGLFAPAVMRQILTRILIIDRYTGEEEDSTDWRTLWIQFAQRFPGVGDCPDVSDSSFDLEQVEKWINSAVEGFAARSDLLSRFDQTAPQEASS